MARQNIQVQDFIVRESGRHRDQFRRPFETITNDAGAINDVRDRVENSITITPSTLSGVASTILAPSSLVEGEVDIANGWGEERNTFMLVVNVRGGLAGNCQEIIQGYTDFKGAVRSHSGRGAVIAPETIFYINSIIQVKNIDCPTPMGIRTSTQVVDNSHLLCDNHFTSIFDQRHLDRMRPEDVFPLMHQSRFFNTTDGDVDLTDTTSLATGVAVKSNRFNGESSNFLSKLLSSYKIANIDTGWTAEHDEVCENARSYAADMVATSDPFLAAIANLRGTVANNNFQIRDLVDLDPRALDHTDLATPGSLHDNSTYFHSQSGEGASWNGRNDVHIAATMLAQAIPAAMSKYGFMILDMQATNRNFEREHIATLSNYEGLVRDAQNQLLTMLLTSIEREILPDISRNNAFDYKIFVHCDLLGDSLILISLNGDIEYEFSVPSFADSLLVPIVTADKQRALGIAGDLNTIIDHAVGYSTGYDVDNSQPTSRILVPNAGGFGRI